MRAFNLGHHESRIWAKIMSQGFFVFFTLNVPPGRTTLRQSFLPPPVFWDRFFKENAPICRFLNQLFGHQLFVDLSFFGRFIGRFPNQIGSKFGHFSMLKKMRRFIGRFSKHIGANFDKMSACFWQIDSSIGDYLLLRHSSDWGRLVKNSRICSYFLLFRSKSFFEF